MRGFVEKVYSLKPKHGADEENLSVLMIRVNQHLSKTAQFDKREIEFGFAEAELANQKVLDSNRIRDFALTIKAVAEDLLSETKKEE